MKTNRIDSLPATVFQAIKQGMVVEPRKALKATKIFYVDKSYPSFTKTITYERYTAEGEAAIVAEGSKNIPVLNDYVEDVTVKVVTVKFALVIDALEQEALKAGNSQFKSRRVSEIIYRINSKIDHVAFLGDKAAKVAGILEVPGANTFTFSKDVLKMTGFELLEAIRDFKLAGEVDDLWMPNVLLVPKKYWPAFTKAISEYDTTSVMDKIKSEGLYDLIEKLDYLDKADSSSPKFVQLDASKENMELALVREVGKISEHVDTADNIQINFGGRTAGVMVYHAKAVTYGTNGS